ncbi:MAG: YjbH domain-containing protein [Pseudomonadota bacterium]
MRIRRIMASSCALTVLVSAQAASAQDLTYNLYGVPGLIDTPNARAAPDAEIGATIGGFRFQQRGSFSFQILPNLSGTFRYAGIDEVNGPGTEGTFDRSFDLRYQILSETETRPAIAIGLQDFLGTGLLASEYVVATKTVAPKVDVTVGLGWGRLGSRNGFDNPLGVIDDRFQTRPALQNAAKGEGGQIDVAQFFRGDAAVFGGVTYQYSDKLTLKAEYSSDGYTRETDNGTLDNRSPLNFGLNYTWRPGLDLQLAYLYGSELAAGATLTLNPRVRQPVSGIEIAPPPIRIRPADTQAALSWGTSEEKLRDLLKDQGITLVGYDVRSDTVARVRYTNTQFRSEAQAMGRVARILSAELPAAVETFVLEPMQAGVPLQATTIQRKDLEVFENRATGAAEIKARSITAEPGPPDGLTPVADTESAFLWGLGPFVNLIVFNGDAPVQLDFGLDLRLQYNFAPNLELKGLIRQSLRDIPLAEESELENDLQNVRTDGRFYGRDGHPVIQSLTFHRYGRPAETLYSRVSAGYLEAQHGGISTELLWKPIESRFAMGAELNYTAQRDFEQLFGFQDYEVLTGHLSGYYSFSNGFHAQVDVGRYLAGDYGATFALDREFDNGWRVGAYFTLTDVPFDEFGEGSFDKGIKITVPHDFFLGTATRDKVETNLQSLRRDGGARLEVDGRLYDIVRDGHTAGRFGDTFGRFWR